MKERQRLLRHGRKKCSRCGEVKLLSAFSRRHDRFAGRKSQCKACVRIGNSKTEKERVEREKKEKQSLLKQGLRRCSTCGKIKQLNAFGKNRLGTGGTRSKCQDCRRKPGAREKAEAQQRLAEQGFKTCARCHKIKPLDNFPNRVGMLADKDARCEECARDYRRRPEVRERRRERSRSPKTRERQKQWMRNNPERIKGYTTKQQRRAHEAVLRAVKQGKLPRVLTQACENCGKQAQHYHHESYKYKHRLDVIPLCADCHSVIHRKS